MASRLIQFRLSEAEFAALTNYIQDGESQNLYCQRIVKEHIGLYTEPNTGVYKQQNEAIADILKRLEALEALAFTQEPSEENTKSTSEKAAASGVQMHKLRRPKSRVL